VVSTFSTAKRSIPPYYCHQEAEDERAGGRECTDDDAVVLVVAVAAVAARLPMERFLPRMAIHSILECAVGIIR
jgi:hypothetical protein